MKKYLGEFFIAGVSIVILMIYNNFVTPNFKLTKEKVAGFVAKIDADLYTGT